MLRLRRMLHPLLEIQIQSPAQQTASQLIPPLNAATNHFNNTNTLINTNTLSTSTLSLARSQTLEPPIGIYTPLYQHSFRSAHSLQNSPSDLNKSRYSTSDVVDVTDSASNFANRSILQTPSSNCNFLRTENSFSSHRSSDNEKNARLEQNGKHSKF